ncbi:MAG: M60 family metallopeptidase [Mediterranea sp.]|jgi:hypothetical protein|nr:M60 family metallopeptidase [Mediterranea sp.]
MRQSINRLKALSATMLCAIALLSCISSCTDTTEYRVNENRFWVDTNSFTFESGASVERFALFSDTYQSELSLSTATNGQSWCTAELLSDSLQISVTDNPSAHARTTVVTLTAQQGARQDIVVTQRAFGLSNDVEVKPNSVTATSFEPGFEPALMIDDDPKTYFNSQFGAISSWPFVLDFYFDDVARVDYITVIARQDGGNGWGAFGKIEIYATTATNSTMTKIDAFDLEQKTKTQSKLMLKNSIVKPKAIEIRVLSALQDRVSAAEVKFFEAGSTFNYRTIFTDGSCSEVKPELTEEDLQKINDGYYKKLALDIFRGNYDRRRIQDYRPYTHPDVMAAVNKTSKYDLKDNVTGMFVENPGEEMVVFMSNTVGQKISLNIRDYQTNKEETFSLEDGLNRITPTIRGLMYIYNHTDDYISLYGDEPGDDERIASKTVRVHFAGGSVNGYFDIRKNSAEDWTEILANARNTEIDIVGKDGHVVWPVDVYRKNNTEMPRQMELIDELIRQQKEFMGLEKYDDLTSRDPKKRRRATNRMFMHIDYSAGAGYSSDYRTAYNEGYNNVFATESGFMSRMWVLGHELGHTNQVRPGVKFAGCTEVTNNIYAMYNQQVFLGEANRLTVDGTNDDDTYETGRKLIIDAEAPWVLPGDNYGRLITKLAPFWQLKLYFVDILGQKDFYHDLFEYYRKTADISQISKGEKYYGALQLDFVLRVCETGKVDLTDFFTKWGMLRTVKASINDYGMRDLYIEKKDIDDIVKKIKAYGYPEPTFDVTELTDENYKQYISTNPEP